MRLRRSLLQKSYPRQQASRAPKPEFADPANAQHAARMARSGRQGDWAGAWDEFSKVAKKDSIVYSTMITTADRCGKFEVGRQLYEEMRNAGHEVMGPTYVSTMAIFARLGQIDKVCELWDEMQAKDDRPTSSSFTIIMSAVASEGNVDAARKYLKEMQEVHKIPPNQAHFGCVLKALRVHGDVDNAFLVLDEMRQAGVKPTIVQYTLVAGCCREAMAHGQDLVDVRKNYEKIMGEMDQDGLTRNNEYFLEESLPMLLGVDVNAMLLGRAVPSRKERDEAMQVLSDAKAAGVRETVLLRAVKQALLRQAPLTYEEKPSRSTSEVGTKLQWRVERKLVGATEELVFYDAHSGEVADQARLVQGWASVPDAQTGNVYFWNVGTGQTAWALPE